MNTNDLTAVLSHLFGFRAGGFHPRSITPGQRPPPPRQPDNTGIKDTPLARKIHHATASPLTPYNLHTHLALKQSNLCSVLYPEHSAACLDRHITSSSHFIPDWQRSVTHFDSNAFCAQFSRDGLTYMVATQDHTVHLYHTHSSAASGTSSSAASSASPTAARRSSVRPFKQIRCRHVGWSIIDVDYSPDSKSVIYSTWSPYIQLCNVFGEYELHEALDMQTRGGRVCFFSVKFSPDGQSILGGTNENCMYLFDVVRKQRLLQVRGHEDDINTVAWADETGNIALTGSDDRTIRVWDVRTLSSSGTFGAANAVGALLGHDAGITHVESGRDGRLVVSNGKDNVIKVWDLRRLNTATEAAQVAREPRPFDYRWDSYNAAADNATAGPDIDASVASLRGHRVHRTLVRCHLSPFHSTGQRYVYTGSAGGGLDGHGSVVVYDILTGDVVRRLNGHSDIVRDVSWHPYEPLLLTASWDASAAIYAGWEDKEDGEEGRRPATVSMQAERRVREEDHEQEAVEEEDGSEEEVEGEEEDEDEEEEEAAEDTRGYQRVEDDDGH